MSIQRKTSLWKTILDKKLEIIVNCFAEVFYDTSYGFREGRSQHQAIDRLFGEISFKGKRYLIDADIKNYFGTISHDDLREFLDRRIKDGVIRRVIDKWLKAGVLDQGQLEYPEEVSPQVGSLSQLLSNIYLRYVLDEWYHEQVRPLLKEDSFLIRWADDFIMGFTRKEDAQRVMEVLPKRFARFKLTLYPEKTRLLKLEAGGKPRRKVG